MTRPAGKIWVSKTGGIPEIVGVIASVDNSLNGDTKELAAKYPATKEGLKSFFDYVVKTVKYKKDGPESEVIKYPTKTLREKTGDCKSLSILIGSFLKDKGIPYKYRFTYTDRNNPLAWHVYPIASLGGKKITMDAVVKEFNKEHPYVKKFDYAPKSIVAISGVGEASPKRPVPAPNYIDTFNFTGGEITAVLLYEQANILYSQNPTQELAQDKELIKDALYNGINDTAGIEKIKRIKNGNLRGALLRAANDKKSLASGRSQAGISNPLIPLEDCSIYLNSAYGQNNPAEFARCEAHNRYKRMLNLHLEGSAHHLLYEYERRPNEAPATVAAKKVMHQGAIDALADITGISRSNIALWIRNGVLRNNAKNGAGALQPEDTIPALPQAVAEGVGALPLPAILAIISAIAAAVGQTIALIGAMKQQEQERMRQAAQTIGQPNFGPQKTDWMTGQQYEQAAQGAGLESGNFLPLAAIAAGAYLITKNI